MRVATPQRGEIECYVLAVMCIKNNPKQQCNHWCMRHFLTAANRVAQRCRHAHPPAQADKEAADKAAEAARAHMEQVTAALRDELEEVQQQHASALERLRADHGRVEVTLHEEVALLQGRLEAAEAAAAAAREEAEAARQEAAALRDEGQALRGAAVEHEAAMGGCGLFGGGL